MKRSNRPSGSQAFRRGIQRASAPTRYRGAGTRACTARTTAAATCCGLVLLARPSRRMRRTISARRCANGLQFGHEAVYGARRFVRRVDYRDVGRRQFDEAAALQPGSGAALVVDRAHWVVRAGDE